MSINFVKKDQDARLGYSRLQRRSRTVGRVCGRWGRGGGGLSGAMARTSPPARIGCPLWGGSPCRCPRYGSP